MYIARNLLECSVDELLTHLKGVSFKRTFFHIYGQHIFFKVGIAPLNMRNYVPTPHIDQVTSHSLIFCFSPDFGI